MKKLYIFSLLFFTIFNTPLLVAQTDLELVKPIIHIGDSLNGGYYGGLPSDNLLLDLTFIYTGAIIKNSGQDTVTNYFLKVNAFGQSSYASDTNFTVYSDTLNYLAPGAIDTIRLKGFNLTTDIYNNIIPENLTLSYQLEHDSIDATPENDSITLPVIVYYENAWEYIGTIYRFGEINDTVNLINNPKYPSGSFIGISIPKWLFQYTIYDVVNLAIDNSSSFQNINLEFRIYIDTTLLTYSSSFSQNTGYSNPFAPAYFDSLTYISFAFNFPAFSYSDTSILTAGIYFEYDTTATNIPPFNILADTGNYHSFEVETRALVNGTWQTADFVPLIFKDLFLGIIEEYQNSTEVYWFPNPASEQTSLRIRQPNLKNYPATVTVLDITGKQVLSAKVSNNQTIDISRLSPGAYMVLTHINGQRFASKLIKP